MSVDGQRYERIPFVLYSRSSSIAASGTGQFDDSDLRNDAGYDFEIDAVGFNIDAQTTAGNSLTNMSVRIWDLSRNVGWMKSLTRVSTLIDELGNTAIGTKWTLKNKTVIPANGNLRCELQNNDSGSAHTYDIAFIGALLVPITPGTRFDEATTHAEHAVP